MRKIDYLACDCGNPKAQWHGDRRGLRQFMCPQCWSIKQALSYLESDYVQRNKSRLGVLGKQDIDAAISALKEGNI